MKFKDVYPGKFRSAADVPAGGRTETVARCVIEELGPERDRKPVLYFEEDPKGLPLNKTNFQSAAAILGDESDEWPGGRLELYSTPVPFKGGTTMGIRIRPARPPRINPTTSRTAPPARGKAPLNNEEVENELEPEDDIAVADYDDAVLDDEPLPLVHSGSGGKQRR